MEPTALQLVLAMVASAGLLVAVLLLSPRQDRPLEGEPRADEGLLPGLVAFAAVIVALLAIAWLLGR